MSKAMAGSRPLFQFFDECVCAKEVGIIVAVNNSLNVAEVQLGPCDVTISASLGDKGVGNLHNLGLVLKNSAMLFL